MRQAYVDRDWTGEETWSCPECFGPARLNECDHGAEFRECWDGCFWRVYVVGCEACKHEIGEEDYQVQD